MNLFHGGSLVQRLVHLKMPFTGRVCQHGEQLLFGFGTELLQVAKSIPAGFQAADRLLKSLFIGFADAHDFTHGTHLCAEFVLHTLKFLEGPAGKLDNHIIPVRHIFIQGAVFAAGDVFQGKAAGQHGGNERDGKARRFGGQGGRAGSPGIDFDDNNPVGFGIMGELHIRAADDLYTFHDPISLLLQTLLAFFRDGEHGSRTEGISGMYA